MNEYDYELDDKQKRYETMPAFFGWIGVACAGLITAAICWNAAAVVQLKSDVAVLIARPESLSRSEYMRDEARIDMELAEINRRLNGKP